MGAGFDSDSPTWLAAICKDQNVEGEGKPQNVNTVRRSVDIYTYIYMV